MRNLKLRSRVMSYDPTQPLGARLHYAYREAMGHLDRERSLYAKFPAEEQAFWDRAAVNFVARLSDAPAPTYGAIPLSTIRNALRVALAFAEAEAEQRADAGGSMSDYITEAQECADTVRHALNLAEKHP